ncbi:MAG TPA: hypothetical protein VFX59_15045 [Polyangiales bacterium]|nr:hypothetical protein [Polyangiales bacterium]
MSACNPACQFGETCTADGRCERGAAAAEPSAQPEPTRPVDAPPEDRVGKDSIVNLHVDVLGALQFGLTPTLEIGKRVSGYLRLRAINSGLASYFLLGRNDDDELRWGLGAALGLHGFLGRDGNMRGLFGGPNLEYAFVRTRDQQRGSLEYGKHSLIPQVDLGYRWGFRRFLLGTGLRLGLVVPVSTTVSAGGFRCGSACDWDRPLTLVGGVFLDLGVFL